MRILCGVFYNVQNLKDIQFAGRFVSDNRELAIPAPGASATESRACSLDPIASPCASCTELGPCHLSCCDDVASPVGYDKIY